MGQGIRVIVVNTEEEVASDLRAVLLSNEGVRIVAEIEEPALLPQALSQLPLEVLLVHLDPHPAGMMDVVAPLIEAHKGEFAAIAMTEDRDAELVMRAMRAGMREFLWKPFPPEQLGEILQRVARDTSSGGRRLGRLIAVVGTSGGVGATQLAINLAVELAQLEGWRLGIGDWGLERGAANLKSPSSNLQSPIPGTRARVAVVDMDFRFGQVAMQLDAQPSYTLAELCETPEQIDAQMIERAMFKHSSGVHLLARPLELAQAERIQAGQAAGVLAALQEHYDFVVVDLPARFDPSARAVLTQRPPTRTIPGMRGALPLLSLATWLPGCASFLRAKSDPDVHPGLHNPATSPDFLADIAKTLTLVVGALVLAYVARLLNHRSKEPNHGPSRSTRRPAA